jgi:predicted transposase/invertase (TIGR01784 family)
VITIVICDHIPLPEEPGYMNRYEVRNERSGGLFPDLAGIVILEIPKLPAEEEEGTGSWLWLKFFRGGSEKELEMPGNRDTGLGKAVELLKELSGSNARRRRAEAKEKRRRDQWAREEYRYREGLEEGLARGIEKKAEESARKMKAAGVAPEQISAWTGLSPEEINRL